MGMENLLGIPCVKFPMSLTLPCVPKNANENKCDLLVSLSVARVEFSGNSETHKEHRAK